MNISKEVSIEPKQSVDNRMHEVRDTHLINCVYFNKLIW